MRELTCLIAEDSSVERDGLRFLIESKRYPVRVLEAANGEDALENMEKERADILITDIRMPFMDGLALSRAIRERGWRTKILICSAYGEFTYAKQAIEYGVSGYLLKPIQRGEFYRQFEQLLSGLEQEEKEEEHDAQTEHGAIESVLRVIHERYREPLTLEGLAQGVHFAPTYLSALFRKKTGTTLIKYLTNYRMERAAEMLTKSDLPIAEIARRVGYDNISYFSLLFKARFGVSPAQFRKARRTGDKT